MRLACGCTKEVECGEAGQLRYESDKIRREQDLMTGYTNWPGRKAYSDARKEYYLHRGPFVSAAIWKSWIRMATGASPTLFCERDSQVGSYSDAAKAAMMCQVLDCILNHGMTLYAAANTVPADRRTVYTWAQEDMFKDAIDEALART